jgi:hypothetical protein
MFSYGFSGYLIVPRNIYLVKYGCVSELEIWSLRVEFTFFNYQILLKILTNAPNVEK